MRNVNRLLGIGAVAAVMGLGACAPMMNGLGFNAYSQCSGGARFSTSARHTTVLRAQQSYNAVQSRYSVGARYAPPVPMARMGGPAVRGECR